jgi:endonuclease/exonuclease/phosphatase family metal-dependent hydrolase
LEGVEGLAIGVQNINLRLLTLNLYRYYTWSERLPKIINMINHYKPDVVMLQEVQLSLSFSPESQAHQIAKLTGYEYVVFSPTMTKERQIDSSGSKTVQAEHGLAMISRFPLELLSNHPLPRHPLDKEPRKVQVCDIEFELEHGLKEKVQLANVHLENNTEVATTQLSQMCEILSKHKQAPVLAGDFNIFNYPGTITIGGQDYASSLLFKPYISYPKDHSTLDYVFIPENYSFKSVICDEVFDGASDHRAVVADIVA